MSFLRSPRRPATRIERARNRLERTARAVPVSLPSSPARRRPAPAATGVWSTGSRWSAGSIASLGSFASVGSLLSAGSVLSIGSAGSILSIGSVGSVLSIGSAGSMCAIGGAGRTPFGSPADGDDDAVGHATIGAVTRLGPLTVLARRAGTVAGACALVAALAS